MERLRQLSQKRWWRLLWAGLCILTLLNLAVAIVRTADREGMLRNVAVAPPAATVFSKLQLGITYESYMAAGVVLLAYLLVGRKMQHELSKAWEESNDRLAILFGWKSLAANSILLLLAFPVWWFVVQLFGMYPAHYICLGVVSIPLCFMIGSIARLTDRGVSVVEIPLSPSFSPARSGVANDPLREVGEPTPKFPATVAPRTLLASIREASRMLDDQYRQPDGRIWFTQTAARALRVVETPRTPEDSQIPFVCTLANGEHFECSVGCVRNTIPLLLRWVKASPERFVLLCSALRECKNADSALRSLQALSHLLRHYPEGKKFCFQQFSQLVGKLEQRFGRASLDPQCAIECRSRAEGFSSVCQTILEGARAAAYGTPSS